MIAFSHQGTRLFAGFQVHFAFSINLNYDWLAVSQVLAGTGCGAGLSTLRCHKDTETEWEARHRWLLAAESHKECFCLWRDKVHLAGDEVYTFLRAQLLSGTGRGKGRREPLTWHCHFDCHRHSRQFSLALVHQRKECGNVSWALLRQIPMSVAYAELSWICESSAERHGCMTAVWDPCHSLHSIPLFHFHCNGWPFGG